MDLPNRVPNRLADYDYSQHGAYFVTICTIDRQKFLSDIVGDDAHIVPTKIGLVVEKFIHNDHRIEKYVIMPDHIHMIVRLDSGAMWASPPTTKPANAVTVSNIIRSIKTLTTKALGIPIFQRSYYDHVIRNQQDYDEIWQYIENNPHKWRMTK